MARYRLDPGILRLRLMNWSRITNTALTIKSPVVSATHVRVTPPPVRPVPKPRVPRASADQLNLLRQKWGAK